MKTVSAISTLCAIALIVPAVFGQDKPREREIAVVGRGFIHVAPDLISFRVGVESNGPTVEAVRRDNDTRANAVLKAIKDAGIPDRDVFTSNSTLRKIFITAEQSQTKKEGTSFAITREFSVIIRKLSGAEEIVASLLKVGANTISDLTFIDSKQKDHRDTALSLAAADTIRLADFLAAQYGSKRGKIVSITPDESQLTSSNFARTEAVDPRSSVSTVPFAPGEIKVEASITARFELE